MASLNIRDVDKELVFGVKAEAESRGQTLRGFVVSVLEKELGKGGGSGVLAEPANVFVGAPDVPVVEKTWVVSRPECPDCGEVMFENLRIRKYWCKCGYQKPMGG